MNARSYNMCNPMQGCMNRSILPSGMGARRVSLEHVENMELWLSENHALVPRDPCSGSQRTVLWFSENRALVLRKPCSRSQRAVLWFSENHALVLREPCSGSQRTVLWFSENRTLVLEELFSERDALWFSK